MPLLLCPNCQTGMQEINRNEVQIDVCTNCRGVWLDRGELEKLLGVVRQTEQEWEQERESYRSRNALDEREELQRQQRQEHYQSEERRERYDIPADRGTRYEEKRPEVNRQYEEKRYETRNREQEREKEHYTQVKPYRKKSAFERLGEFFD